MLGPKINHLLRLEHKSVDQTVFDNLKKIQIKLLLSGGGTFVLSLLCTNGVDIAHAQTG